LDSDPDSRVRPVVIDTNIVLDMLVFHDAGTERLKKALTDKHIHWLATVAMREELVRVLDYPKIKVRLDARQNTAEQVLRQFDAQVQIRAEASPAPLRCQDPDDQKFLDLAVAHKATLLSKDRALLCLKKRLLVLSVRAQTAVDL
jgi:putative PIN family toxin of toxin-antitoxin system